MNEKTQFEDSKPRGEHQLTIEVRVDDEGGIETLLKTEGGGITDATLSQVPNAVAGHVFKLLTDGE